MPASSPIRDRCRQDRGSRHSRAVPSTLAQVERHFDEQTVLEVGGWDRRYAVVRAVRTVDDRAAAVIDSNGDGGDINLEQFAWADGQWQLLSSSGSAGNWGRGWCTACGRSTTAMTTAGGSRWNRGRRKSRTASDRLSAMIARLAA